MRFKSTAMPLLACLIVAGGATAASVKPAPAKSKVVSTQKLVAPTKVTSVEGITEYRLQNGLRVLMFPDASKPTVTVNITYLVGSMHENYGETGMAHLLEHLAFKPTKQKYSGENGTKNVVEVLNTLGARFNGSTWLDRTNYFISFPAQGENLKTILDLEADRMVNARIAQKDLWDKEAQKGEMTVVRNEFEMGESNPIRVTLQRTMAAAFEWHNYGKSTIGARTDIENVSIDRLRAFYETYYQPDNAVLLVAGKIDEGKALEMVNETFGRIPKPGRVIQKTYTLDPTQDGERSVMVRRVGDAQLLMNAYHIPAGSHTDFAALDVLGRVMAEEGNGRLYKALVDTKQAQFVFPFVFGTQQPGLALFGTQFAKDADAEKVKATFTQVLEGVKGNPLTAEEVEKAKRSILKDSELTLNDSTRFASGLSESIAQGDWRYFFLNRDRVEAVKVEDVQRAAECYFKPVNRTMGQFIPEDKPLRAEIPVVADASVAVKNYQGRAVVAQGENFDASPSHIDTRTERWQTAAGMKVAFLPKKTRGELVNVRMQLHLGDEQSLQGRGVAGQVVGQLLMRGTTRLNKEQFKEALDKLKAEVSIFGDAETAYISLNTTKANLSETIKLVAEALQKPALDQAELERVINENIIGLESQKREPQALASIAIEKHTNRYPKGHVRAFEDIDESIATLKAVQLDAVKAFHQDFYGASTGELALVGDFDAKESRALLTELFGNWKPKKAFARIPARNFNVPAANLTLEAPDKPNGFFLASLEMAIKDTDADYPALMLADRMLGGGMLKSRLADRIRQKEGLSYGVGSEFSANSFDAKGTWQAMAIYNPGNVEKLEAAFQEELAKALKDGFAENEIKDAKGAWLQGQAQGRTQDGELASRIRYQLYTGRTMAYQAELEKKVQNLTASEIHAALRKHLNPANLVIAKAGDFKSAAIAKAEAEKNKEMAKQ